MSKYRGILLVGPTGAGKTPLGAELEDKGWAAEGCVHLDFGAELREAAACRSNLNEHEREHIRGLLSEGRLFEKEDLPLAIKIIENFLVARIPHCEGRVVLNGFPRHVMQAELLESIVAIELVIVLECTPEVVRKRIAGNSGGDRTGRVDDHPELITKKLAAFYERTLPLIDYYSAHQAQIRRLNVHVDSTGSSLRRQLEAGPAPERV